MSEYLIQDSTLNDIADAIRNEANISNRMSPIEMPQYIRSNMNKNFIELVEGDITSVYNNKIKNIRNYAFYGCTDLSYAEFPNALSIGAHAFEKCTGGKQNTGGGGIPETGGTITVSPIGLTLIAPQCYTIGSSAFNECHLSSINLGIDTLELSDGLQIGFSTGLVAAPVGYKGLTTVEFSKLSYIGSSVFQQCTALKNVSIPQAEIIYNYAFRSCTSLENISFPICSMVQREAFKDNTSLKSVYLPNLSNYYFSTKVSQSPFYGCTELEYVNMGSITNMSALFSGFSNLKTVELPGTTSLAAYCFQSCISLTDISIPACTFIGSNAFKGCLSLSSIELPNVTSIQALAFFGNDALVSVSIPAATSISTRAFEHCDSLEKIHLPELTYLQSFVFRSCATLKEIDAPLCSNYYTASNYFPWSNVTTLEYVTMGLTGVTGVGLKGQQNLKYASLPSCTAITAQAFAGCYSLKQFAVPSTASIIYKSAFLNCSSLMSLLLLRESAITVLSNVNAFANTPLSVSVNGVYGSIYVPEGLYQSYITATNWSIYKNRIVSVPLSYSIGHVFSGIGSGSPSMSGTWYVSPSQPISFGQTWKDIKGLRLYRNNLYGYALFKDNPSNLLSIASRYYIAGGTLSFSKYYKNNINIYDFILPSINYLNID